MSAMFSNVISLSVILACLGTPAFAETIPDSRAPNATLADLSFLIGHWNITGGRITLYGARPQGTYEVETVANGGGLFVRAEGVAIGVEGQRLGTSESAMLIYGSSGTLNAQYVNHLSSGHYKAISIIPGHSATFVSDPRPNGVILEDRFELQDDGRVVVSHLAQRPGQQTFALDVTEELTKANSKAQ